MSNPFRKQGGSQPGPPQLQIPPIDTVDANTSSSSGSSSRRPTPPPPPPPATTFRTTAVSPPPRDDHRDDSHLEDVGRRHGDEEGGRERRRRSKVVKKVRVQSPPPLSPDTPTWSYRDAGAPLPSAVSFGGPFGGSGEAQAPPAPQHENSNSNSNSNIDSLGPPPANPFSKTLEDLENAKKHDDLIEERREEGAALKAANMARGSLDVGAFKRLLMTGHTEEGQSLTSGAAVEEAALSITRDIEATRPAVSPEVTTAAATVAVDGGESDSSIAMQIGTRKKVKTPPPPPSSRHGKSIKAIDGKGSPEALATATSEKKPLPPEPAQVSSRPEADTEAHATRDTRGEKPTEAESTTVAKKPVPAPPPRRGHARMESRMEQGLTVKDDEAPPRSSTETAVLDRSNSVRQSAAPAPPPPRRLQANQRPLSLQPSPTSATFSPALANAIHTSNADSTLSSPTQEHTSPPLERTAHSLPPDPPNQVKLAAPPPPPARNRSVRRPPSAHSAEPTSRRTSGETKNRDSTQSPSLPPPPPPTRKRGSSRSSVVEGGPPPPQLQRTSRDGGKGGSEAAVPGHGEDILADLDALKREVDALRGTFH